jgi:hypothetical protein
MKRSKMAQYRQRIKSTSIPSEIISRVERLYEVHSLRGQRDVFTTVLKQGNEKYRWNDHLIALPYYHIVETTKYGDHLKLHVYDIGNRRILSLILENGILHSHRIIDEGQVATILPDRFKRSGWLCKKATTSQIKSVCRIIGIQEKNSPEISAANANVVIQTAALSLYLPGLQGIIKALLQESLLGAA